MKIETYIDSLVSYAMNTGLADPLDHHVLTNRLLELEEEVRRLKRKQGQEAQNRE